MLLNTFNSLEPAKRRNLLTLFITGLFFWISITSLLPTLPAYIQSVGATKQQVGLVMGCFAIGLLLSRTFLGWLADSHSRKLVILIGIVVVITAPLGYIFTESIPVLMGLRAFHGISVAAFTTGYSALVVDLSPLAQRGELIGYMSLAVSIGMAVGPALGGFLETETGYTVLFLVSAGCGFLGLILGSMVREKRRISPPVSLDKGKTHQQPEETHPQPEETHPQPRLGGEKRVTQNSTDVTPITRSFWELMGNRAFQIPTIVLLLVGLLFGTLITFLPLYVEEAKIDLNVGLFYTATAIASFSVRIFAGRISDTLGRGLLITGGLVCYGVSMLLLALATTPQFFLVAAVIEGVAAGVVIPMMLALMSDRSYDNERGKVSSICIGGFDLGIALAGPVLGAFGEVLSYRGMFTLTGSFAIFALLIFLTQSGSNLTHSVGFALGREKDDYALE